MGEADKKYKVVDSTTSKLGLFQIRMDTVDKEGAHYPYSFVEQKDSVGVLAFSGDKIILINQYRHAMGSYEYEIPGGGIDTGEQPIEVAKRELLEETGYAVDSLESLGSYYPSPGSSNEVSYLFVAQCHRVKEPCCEPLEYMTVKVVGKDEFEKMISDGTFKHSMGLVAWLKYCMGR